MPRSVGFAIRLASHGSNCTSFSPHEPQCRIRRHSITVLQSTSTDKPRCRVLYGMFGSEVEGKGAHLQQQPPSHEPQAAIAIKGELQNRLHLAAAIAPRRREKSARRQFSPLCTSISPPDCKSRRNASRDWKSDMCAV